MHMSKLNPNPVVFRLKMDHVRYNHAAFWGDASVSGFGWSLSNSCQLSSACFCKELLSFEKIEMTPVAITGVESAKMSQCH